MTTQDYSVTLHRHPDGTRSTAETRTFSPELGSKANDPSVGFNPVETLLSAAGACMTSSLGLVAENSDVVLEDVAITVTGERQSKPPRLVSAEIEVAITSPATDDKLDRMLDIANRSSTVVSTLQEAMDVKVRWKRLDPGPA